MRNAPILFEKDETEFISNGICRLYDAISVSVSEERNGLFECDFEYPVTGANFEKIQCGRIIYTTHDDTGIPQPFDIVSYSKPINGVVTFHAVHVSYRTSGIVAQAQNINSLDDAFRAMVETAQPSDEMVFTFNADFTSTAYMAAFDNTPRSIRQLLGGIDGSVLDTYGGEYEFDRFNITLHQERGVMRDFRIRYGVNMLDFTDDTDYQGIYTSCIPYWKGADSTGAETVVYGNRVDSGAVSYNGRNVCSALDLSDKFEEPPTTAQLESMAQTYMNANQTFMPHQSIKVDFVRLQDMGFEGLDNLLQCNLCDTITVEFPDYSMAGAFKIVKTVWDALEGRYTAMELCTLSVSLADALGISNSLGGSGGGASGDDLNVRGDLNVGGDTAIVGSLVVGGYNMSHVEELTVTSQYADIVKVWKCGHVVTVRFANFKAIPAQTFAVTTLPAGWRPYETVTFDMQQPRAANTTTGISIRCTIDTLGRINCYNYATATSGSTNVSGSISYVIGSAL